MDGGNKVQALSWEHLTVQPRHHQLQCGDWVTEVGGIRPASVDT